MKKILTAIAFIVFFGNQTGFAQSLNNTKFDGYKGIWFELNQKYEYGDKYSGALGTYTAKHKPIAMYSPEVNKTFFVFGGTRSQDERHLLCMVGVFDHTTKMVSKPTVAYDKNGVNDPHDNPSLMIDKQGYIWIFVSGRGSKRVGIKLKSEKPYSIEKFKTITEETFTYPQIWNTKQGYFHFFTKYTGVRELYYETSVDGNKWTSDRKLAGIKEPGLEKAGHYQSSGIYKDGEIIGTFFNRHKNGHPDTRTDLYYIQTKDFGETWQSISGEKSEIPLEDKVDTKERVIDYQSQGKNVYMKDMGFDKKGNPVCLYIRSGGHEPGPKNEPYEWCITSWDGSKWHTNVVCTSDHNYDMGSLWVNKKTWAVVGPTVNGPQKYGVGGEVTLWESKDKGMSWKKTLDVTSNSELNNSYVRKVVGGASPFQFFWASGHPHTFSISELYFGDFEGNVWRLPYTMTKEWEKPVKVE